MKRAPLPGLPGALRRDRRHLAPRARRPRIEHFENAFPAVGQNEFYS